MKNTIEDNNKELERITGVSRNKILKRLIEIANGAFLDITDKWMNQKEFEKLKPEQLSCILECTIKRKINHDKVAEREIEYFINKLHNPQRAVVLLNKMLGLKGIDKVDIENGPLELMFD